VIDVKVSDHPKEMRNLELVMGPSLSCLYLWIQRFERLMIGASST